MHRILMAALGLSLIASGAFASPIAPSHSAIPSERNLLRVSDTEGSYGAADDDTDFLFRLGMLEGHLMVGHDLLKAGKPALALPHFGHPVRELYADISDYLEKHHSPAFDGQLIKLEAAVTTAPDAPETDALYQSTIASVHKAREIVPAQLRASVPEMIKVCADTVDAAAGEYGEALEHGRIETIVEYHDSRGYLSYVAQELQHLMDTHKDASDQALLTRFKVVLAKAQYIVAPLLPGPVPRGSVGEYRAVAEQAVDIAKK
ncbi:MAG TPA: hypothetical protein VFR09_07995 [Alphaproteobacteria bacterium]|nr:hypothetical protein [Alphaproteobacteria bacterium]